MTRLISPRRHVTQWLLLVVLLTGAGCSGTATVTGNVTYQGRPVTYGSVTFLNVDRTARSGVIQPDGSYQVDDVPRGTVKIGVISRDPSKGRSTLRGQKPQPRDKPQLPSRPPITSGWFPLPLPLENPEGSGLTCTVDSRHVVHNIELK